MIEWKSMFNFGIGMVLGVLANYIWLDSIYVYWFIFCPISVSIFILINSRLVERKQWEN